MGFGRILEAQDDELACAYYAANETAGSYDRRRHSRAYERRALKLLQWGRPHRPWTLKSPTHLLFLPYLDQAFPGASVNVLDSGHWPFVDNVAKVDRLVIPFWRRNVARPATGRRHR